METATTTPPAAPRLQPVSREDVQAALRAGLADFRRAPAFGLFFGAVFAAIGIVIVLQLMVWETVYWVFPLMAGFPLLGPFLAVGLYEVSRRIELGEPLEWPAILTVLARERKRELPYMAVVTAFFLLAWLYIARLIFALSFGTAPITNVFSTADLFFTGPGLTMLVVGTIVGGGLALLLFALTAISVPMLLDRDIDIVTAMITSFQAVNDNREGMLYWAAVVAVLTAVAMVPLFLGMLVVFPVLGHATWHLYRKAVAPAE